MRRLLAICTAAGLLCGALGCHCCGGGESCVHGRCDCDQGPLYGCHSDGMMGHEHIMPAAAVQAAQATPVAEPLKAMPKDTMPPEDGK
jgi:hypothetical protein